MSREAMAAFFASMPKRWRSDELVIGCRST
jgi:hypothetical protein